MSDETKDDPRQGRGKSRRGDASSPDERAASLERELAEERANSAALRDTVDQLHFKIGVLEKSYATQLAEARARCEKAEAGLAAHEQRLAALGPGGDDTLKRLAESRAEVARLNAECDRLREHARGGRQPSPFVPRGEPPAEDGSLTINELIADAAWAPERRGGGDSKPRAAAHAESEPAPEVMLAPELVFTRGREGRDDDER